MIGIKANLTSFHIISNVSLCCRTFMFKLDKTQDGDIAVIKVYYFVTFY